MDKKSKLRMLAKNLRKNLDINKISTEICTRIRKLDIYKISKNIMIYYPMKYEINLLELLNDNKNFYFPRVEGNELVVCSCKCDFKKSNMGIMEPQGTPLNPEILDLIFVPALMVDCKNYRLGYGGGYYDRFLSKYPKIKTISAIPNCLKTDTLPCEIYDIPVDEVITTMDNR